MNEQIETAARAEAERREWTVPEGTPYINGVRPTDVQEWIEDAFVAGVAWAPAQPRTVSAEQAEALASVVHAGMHAVTHSTPAMTNAEGARYIARAVLAALHLTVAEAVNPYRTKAT